MLTDLTEVALLRKQTDSQAGLYRSDTMQVDDGWPAAIWLDLDTRSRKWTATQEYTSCSSAAPLHCGSKYDVCSCSLHCCNASVPSDGVLLNILHSTLSHLITHGRHKGCSRGLQQGPNMLGPQYVQHGLYGWQAGLLPFTATHCQHTWMPKHQSCNGQLVEGQGGGFTWANVPTIVGQSREALVVIVQQAKTIHAQSRDSTSPSKLAR